MELPPEDSPPVAGPRQVPRGVLWAAALATVVLAIATLIAFTTDPGGDDVTVFDPNDTAPANELRGTDVVGRSVPDQSFETFEGGSTSLASFEGTPLVVNFFASWCAPCIDEMPEFERVHQRFGEQVTFVGLNVTDELETARALVARTGVTYQVGRDPTGSMLEAFGGAGMPTTVIVAADGTITEVHTGRLSEAELTSLVERELQS